VLDLSRGDLSPRGTAAVLSLINFPHVFELFIQLIPSTAAVRYGTRPVPVIVFAFACVVTAQRALC
jgi:hypothetical protein